MDNPYTETVAVTLTDCPNKQIELGALMVTYLKLERNKIYRVFVSVDLLVTYREIKFTSIQKQEHTY